MKRQITNSNKNHSKSENNNHKTSSSNGDELNSSGKKYKSKEAARVRRNKENYEFRMMSNLLPLKNEIKQQLDKASIIRLTINYLKLKLFLNEVNNEAISCSSNHFSIAARHFKPWDLIHFTHMVRRCHLNCVEGFVFILSEEAIILYISESVSAFLGLSQVAMIGTSIFDYVHSEDLELMCSLLRIIPKNLRQRKLNQQIMAASFWNADANQRDQINQTIRFRSSLAKKKFPVRSNGWRQMRLMAKRKSGTVYGKEKLVGFYCVAYGSEMDSSSSEESLNNDSNEFLLKLNQDFVIISIEKQPTWYFNSTADLTGKSIFHLVHLLNLRKFQRELEILKKFEQNTFEFDMIIAYGEEVIELSCSCFAYLEKASSSSISSSNSISSTSGASREHGGRFLKQKNDSQEGFFTFEIIVKSV